MPSQLRRSAPNAQSTPTGPQAHTQPGGSWMSHQRELFSMQSQSQSSSSSSSSSSGLWGAAANTQAQNDPMELANANAAPTLAEIEGGAVLDQGHTGPAVAWVQGALNRLGYPVAQSGTFGSMTIGLLRQFQQTNKVAATGQVGPTTLSRLQAAVEASVSIDELAQLAPGVDRATLVEYLPHLNAAMLQHGITSDARKAAFLAQLGHESDGFHTLEEYASGSAYEGRSDLGNVFAGDGRRFKGRGPIQITGRYNYKQYGEKLGVDLIANPELAATPELGFQIAGQYWADHGLNELADSGHFDTITSRINGGQNGRTDRRRRWGQAQDVLAQSAGKPKVSMPETLTQTPSPAPALASGQTLFASHNSTPGTTGPAATGDAQSTSSPQLTALCSLIGKDDATMARSAAARFAAERRAQLGMANDSLTRAAGEVWQAADDMVHAQAALQEGRARDAQEAAHKAANALRALRDEGLVDAAAVDPAVARAGRIWTQANALSQQNAETNGQAHSGYAVWTTGRPGGRGGVTSRELNRNGDWDQNNWLSHHSDRSSSWAANNIRNGKNQDLQAYDFTFERQNARGEGIAGSAQGLELISPWDAKVHDVNPHFYGSGGYGKFIALEDLETGLRFEVHHLDSVADVRRGETLDGGDVIGTQGASGSSRYDYATHVDIVGTPEAVEQFVRANQSGRFKSNKKRGGAV